MTRFLLILSCSTVLAWGADLAAVRSVYILPMAHGLDQYLANRLTNSRLFQVVTDPKLADAVLTDHVGSGLEAQLAEMLPAPEAPKPEPPKPEPATAEKNDPPAPTTMFTNTVNKLDNPAARSTLGRAKGTVFLVDLKSRQVVWSVYQPSKDATSRAMDRTASDIVGRLKGDLNPKQK